MKEAKVIIQKKYPDKVVKSAIPTGKGWVFSLYPKQMRKGATYMDDPYHIVKSDGTVAGYSPVMDPEDFKAGMSRRIMFK